MRPFVELRVGIGKTGVVAISKSRFLSGYLRQAGMEGDFFLMKGRGRVVAGGVMTTVSAGAMGAVSAAACLAARAAASIWKTVRVVGDFGIGDWILDIGYWEVGRG